MYKITTSSILMHIKYKFKIKYTLKCFKWTIVMIIEINLYNFTNVKGIIKDYENNVLYCRPDIHKNGLQKCARSQDLYRS